MYINLYEFENNTFNFHKTISINDILEYSYTQRDFPNYDELEISFKPKQDYINLVPISKTEEKKPLLLVKKEGNFIRWFSFIISREFLNNKEESKIILKGTSFFYFENKKLISSNKNYTITDPEIELPEDFALYRKNDDFNNHLNYFYETAFLNPKELTYGRISTTDLEIRKFKGLEKIEQDYNRTEKKEISLEQKNVTECKGELFSLFNFIPKQEQIFNEITGTFKIKFSEPKFISENITRNSVSVTQENFGYMSTNNFIFGIANPNNDVNVYDVKMADFTTSEIQEDFEFVSGSNNTYLTNTSKTALAKITLDRQIYVLDLYSNVLFSKINCGDLLDINNRDVRVKEIKETNSASGITFSLEIEEI